VLLVEDNIVNQKVALGFLKRMNLTADVASDGQQALDRIGEQHFDLVLMDMQMPVMDGLTATTRIRAMENGAHVPIIAMTANALHEDRERCLAAGMDDYLAKPLQGKQLRAMIMKYLGTSSSH
jgi:two-component system sensor histidine kinase/response regulator